jgi:YihY family inner membrane protein
VSTAKRVPETALRLDGDAARETLTEVGKTQLLKDAFARLRAADGTSHARSLAFMGALVLVQALIVLLGTAAAFGNAGLTTKIADNVGGAVPGPAGTVLTDAVQQANRVGAAHAYVPLLLGLLSLLITAAFAMGQMERGLNRLYGVERDRPSRQKYTRALLLAVSVGPLLGAALLLIGFAPDPAAATSLGEVWIYARWPIALGLVGASLAMLLRLAPNRHQPGRAWLSFGAITAVVLWMTTTIALAVAFRFASTFPQTYGPLAGVVALLLWTYLSALAIFYGVAVAAELEAVAARGQETKERSLDGRISTARDRPSPSDEAPIQLTDSPSAVQG